jgi:hypothetical protein
LTSRQYIESIVATVPIEYHKYLAETGHAVMETAHHHCREARMNPEYVAA